MVVVRDQEPPIISLYKQDIYICVCVCVMYVCMYFLYVCRQCVYDIYSNTTSGRAETQN
jgi:hypothetical protein